MKIAYDTDRLFTPGPVPFAPEVLQILSQPSMYHRSPAFAHILKDVLKNLCLIFETQQPVFIQTATGTGLMESALVNTLHPGDHVLIVNAGKFGQRWVEMAKALGLKTTEMTVPWGHAVDPEHIQEHLSKSKDIKAILIQATETSTGVLQPLRQIAQLTQNTETLLIIDASVALDIVELSMDAWGLDVVMAGGQKAFMLPPGVGFIALSQKAWDQKSTFSKFYWDLKAEWEVNQKGFTRFTSAVTHIRVLQWVLQQRLHTKNYKKRYLQIAKALRASSTALGFKIFPQVPSPALTVLTRQTWVNEAGQQIGASAIKAYLQEKYRITVAGGQEHFKERLLRIGHLGYITNEDIIALVQALADTLKHFGFVCDAQKALSVVSDTLEQTLE